MRVFRNARGARPRRRRRGRIRAAARLPRFAGLGGLRAGGPGLPGRRSALAAAAAGPSGPGAVPGGPPDAGPGGRPDAGPGGRRTGPLGRFGGLPGLSGVPGRSGVSARSGWPGLSGRSGLRSLPSLRGLSGLPGLFDPPGLSGRSGFSGRGRHRAGHGAGAGSGRRLWPFGQGGGLPPFRAGGGFPPFGPGGGLPPLGPGGGRPTRAVLAGMVCLAVALIAGAVLWAVGSGGQEEGAAGRGVTRPEQSRAGAHQAPKPVIVPRERWADETVGSRPPARYDDRVVAVFVHHTDSPNGYDCADTPRVIRGLYTGQTEARHWDDIGYNFLVDRCGTIYEGRAGGVDRAVTGAHTQGFNHRTAGIAAIGTFTAGVPVPDAMTDAIAALAAWKLGLSGVDPRGGARLTSSSDRSRYPAGTTAMLPALAGHTDGFMTSCPGAALAERLPAIREAAARLQGRR